MTEPARLARKRALATGGGRATAMALNLAPELAERRVAINAIAPGGTATDMAAEVGALYTQPALRDVPLQRSSRRYTRLAG
jgi:NAD(P)-dependent dehydrogenase (short-subunit alcohol dehydrogenase family)